MSATAARLHIEALAVLRDGRRVLHDVSFSIGAGEALVLRGPNGAGKTTLLRCLAALDLPFSGQVKILDIDTTVAPRKVHKHLGYLADIYGLYDGLTVHQSLAHAASLRALPSAEIPARITRAAERLGIADRLPALASTLSRGLRQRLAIAQAIIHDPAILLLDEPASGLDPEARQDLSTLLRELRQGGMTIMVSSHILAELEDYSTEMLILDKGRIVDHTPIKGHSITAPRTRRLVLEIGGSSDGIAAKLALEAEVSKINATGDGVEFQFSGDEAAQVNLLKRLVTQGVPVRALWERRTSFQDTYVARVRRIREENV